LARPNTSIHIQWFFAVYGHRTSLSPMAFYRFHATIICHCL
jgi:hypothetical protein